MFERFNDRAKKAAVAASDEAKRFHHDRVETGHWLVGLMADPESISYKALKAQGLIPDVLRYLVDALNRRPHAEEGARLPYSPESRWLLEMADRERSTIGHSYIGPEHLLLALTRLFEVEAANTDTVVLILRKHNAIDVDALRAEVFRLIKRPPVKADLLEWKGVTTTAGN